MAPHTKPVAPNKPPEVTHSQPDLVLDLDEIKASDVLLSDWMIRYVVSVATRAPSIHNSQPWHFVAGPAVLDLYADRTRQLRVIDPDGRQLYISAGAALHHALLALHGLGRDAHVALLPDSQEPDLLARITIRRWSSLPGPQEWAMLHATGSRHTHRSPFSDGRLPKSTLVDLATAAEQQGGQVRFVELAGERRVLADLVTEATHRLEVDPEYRNEVLLWSGRNQGAADGVPASALAPPATGDEFRQRTFGPTPSLWVPGADAEHPDILMLWSPADSPEQWLRSGLALSALLLSATSAGIGVGMLNQPLEIPALRARVRQELRLPGFPQMLLRVGHSASVRPSPRRPISEVLSITPPASPVADD
jgi:nitroreductase